MVRKGMQLLTVELVMKRLNKKTIASKQKGVVLIFIAFIIGLATAAYVLKTLNVSNLKAEQDAKTMQSLKEAKVALIAWAVNHPNVPGLMPYPDRNVDGNYDDTSDCYASNIPFNPNFVLGRLPLFKNDPNCINATITVGNGLSEDFRDGTGERLWYEVSSNLLYDYNTTAPMPNREPPIVNPSIVNNPLVEPWMIVRDRNGVILSSRVAAVIISPGSPLPNQDRSGGIANPNQYLDKIVMANNTPYQNYGYSLPGLPQEFIIGDDYRNVAKNDPTYKNQAIQPYYYNDKLVYITIDELMAALEKRAASEVKVAINNYKVSTGYNPYASILGGHKNYSCVVNKFAGALPMIPSHISSCSYNGITASSSNSSCNFTEVDSVVFTKTGTNFTASNNVAPNNNCTFSGKVCTCTGAGNCTRGGSKFVCDAAGVCSANVAGSYKFGGGAFDSVTGKCTSTCGSDIACSGVGAGNFTHSACTDSPFNSVITNSQLAPWFSANSWQDYIYYALQRGASPTLTVGAKIGVKALTITTGYPIIAPFVSSKGVDQVRLSCAMNDSLDTNVNVNGNLTNVYETLNKPRNQSYNDQIFIISP